MTDTNDGMLDSFLNWLFGLEDKEAENLSEFFKNFRKYHNKDWNEYGSDVREQIKNDFKANLDSNIDVQREFSQFMQQLGVDENLVKDIEQLSKAYGNYFLTGWRGVNAFGGVKQDIKALKDRVNKYKEKVGELNKKSDASMEKIVGIKTALLKVEQIDQKLADIEENENFKKLDDNQKKKAIKLAKEQLEKERDKIIRDAAKYRSVNRPLSFVRDIERELKNTLSREERKYASLTGEAIEVKIEGKQIKATKIDAFKKLGDTITTVDALDELSKHLEATNSINKDSSHYGIQDVEDLNRTKELIEKVPQELRLSIFKKGIINEDGTVKADADFSSLKPEELQKTADKLIKESKHMRSLDHRAGQTRGLILAELKWTHNRNQKGSEEKKALEEAVQDVNRYTKRLKKAQATLQAAHKTHTEVKGFLESLGKVDTTALKRGGAPSSLPGRSSQQTTMEKQ